MTFFFYFERYGYFHKHISTYNACMSVCSVISDALLSPWTGTHQAPKSMGFSRQGYWSGLPFSYPGDIPNPGIEPTSLMSPALAGGFFTTSAAWEAQNPLLSLFILMLIVMGATLIVYTFF